MTMVSDPVSPSSTDPAPTGLRTLVTSPMADQYLVTFAVTILCTVGAMMVLSASSVQAEFTNQSPYYYAIRHVIFMFAGVIGAFVISRISPRVIQRLGWLGWLLSMVGLALVLTPLGHEIYGNRNWIKIGGLIFQPSEFAKLGLIVWAAAIWHAKRGRLHEVAQLLVPFVPGAAILLAPILAGRDLGTGIIVAIIIVSLLFFIGTSYAILIPSAIIAITGMILLVSGSGNRMSRISVFLDPESNTDLSSQPMAALYALASGGWWGLGLGASRQKWGELKNAAHTDYIFAVIGEELGLFGVLVVIAMFAILARAVSSSGVHHHLSRHSGNWIFPCAAHVVDDGNVGQGHHLAELVREVHGSGIEVRLETGDESTLKTCPLVARFRGAPRSGQGCPDFGWVVGVVVEHADSSRVADELESTQRARVSTQSADALGM